MATKILGDSGVLYTDRRDFYISPYVVKELWTDVAPFTTLVANRGTMTPPDPLFKMFEHRDGFVKQQFFVNDAGPAVVPNNDTGVTVNIDSVTGLVADSSLVGLEVEVWDKDLLTLKGQGLITACASATAITVKSLNAAVITLADNDVIMVVGNAHGEASESPEAYSDELSVVYNSTQIFRTPVEISGTLLAAALRGERNELGRMRDQKNKLHKIQKERAFLMGSSLLGTGMSGAAMTDTARTDANGKKVRTTMGFIPALTKYGKGRVGAGFANSSSVDEEINLFSIPQATYKYSNFVDDTELVFQFIPEAGAKYAFVGSGAMSYWSKIDGAAGFVGKSGWQVKLSESRLDTLGFSYRQLETPHGLINLVPTPVLRGPYKNYMLVVSDENLFHAQYRSPQFRANIKTDNAPDLVKDEYFSDEGIGITLIESHKLFKIV